MRRKLYCIVVDADADTVADTVAAVSAAADDACIVRTFGGYASPQW